MKTPPFEYHAPETVEEVVAILAEHGDEAKILAGGQSLVPLLAMRLSRPAHLVDVNGVRGLDHVDERGDAIAVGAVVRQSDAERSPVIGGAVPLLAAALPYVGHRPIRNRGTIGGSLAHADASSELPAVALATDARMVLRSVRGERVVLADSFFAGHFTTAVADDELLVEVQFPTARERTGSAVYEVVRRHGDFAIAGAATMIVLDDDNAVADCRIALFGVASAPVRMHPAEEAIVGRPPRADAIADAAEVVTSSVDPASDVHGSAAYRRHVAGVAVRRSLAEAASRAESGRA